MKSFEILNSINPVAFSKILLDFNEIVLNPVDFIKSWEILLLLV